MVTEVLLNQQEEELALILDDLKRVHYFCDLPSNVKEQLAATAVRHDFSPSETIATSQQFDQSEVFCIVKGRVKQTDVSSKDGNITVEEHGSGNVIGMEHVLGECHEMTTQTELVAITQTTAIMIESDTIRNLVMLNPPAARVFLSVLARKMIAVKSEAYTGEDTQKRIFHSLFDMVRKDVSNGKTIYSIAQMPKHKELSECAGVSEIDAAEAVAYLISEGIAKREYPGLIIQDYLKFKNLSF